MLQKAVLLPVFFFIVPVILGHYWVRFDQAHKGNLCVEWLYGWLTMLGLYQIVSIPFIQLRTVFSYLNWCYLLIAGLLCVFSLIRERSWQEEKKWVLSLKKQMTAVKIVVLACILFQCIFVTCMEHKDADDAYYVATSVTTLQKNSIYHYNPYTGKAIGKNSFRRYKIASWPLFIATASYVSSVHPTIIAHTVLPAIILLLAYLSYALIGEQLFEKDQNKRDLFMLFLVIIASWSGFSVFSSFTFLFIRSWQGKAALAGFGVPALFCVCMRIFTEKDKKELWPDFVLLSLSASAICSFTLIGCAFAGMIIGSFALVEAVKQKKIIPLAAGAGACILPVLYVGLSSFIQL